MDGQNDRWMNEWKHRLVNIQRDECIYRQMDEQRFSQKDRQID